MTNLPQNVSLHVAARINLLPSKQKECFAPKDTQNGNTLLRVAKKREKRRMIEVDRQ